MSRLKKIIIILSPILCFLVIWGGSLEKCELLTLAHGNEFAEVYKENTMLGDMEYWKVLDYSENYARIYYVSANFLIGAVLSFTKKNGHWKYNKWESTWAVGGTADDVIWPYWCHCFYHLCPRPNEMTS